MENFKQQSELDKARIAILHEPQMETFILSLHPVGALFKDFPYMSKLEKNFRDLEALLRANGVNPIFVRDALKLNLDNLKELANSALVYKLSASEAAPEDIAFFASDEYKKTVVDKMTPDQLVEVVLTQPHIVLEKEAGNTGVVIKTIEAHPVGNLVYTRDQVITTAKGVIVGRFNARVRHRETEIMKTVYKNLGIECFDGLPEECFLEGGDFIFAKQDLALLGIGMRTNLAAGQYLMANDLFGSETVALIIDENDKNQERMHLDTFFNIISDKAVLLTNFAETDSSLCRRVEVYSKQAQLKEFGNYGKVEEFDNFADFLTSLDYKIVYITLKQQEEFMANLVTLGENKLIAIHPELKQLLEKNNVTDVEVIDLDFEEVKKLYGGVHCATQIAR